MAFEFKFPDVGEGIHEGKIVSWLVAAGDRVQTDQPFVKVETDKAVVDLPAPKAGVVLSLNFKAGDTIHVGDVLATFGEEGESAPPATSEPASPPPRATEPDSTRAPQPSAGKILATPHTRAYARKLGVDLAAVAPSGKGGRITDEDVERAAQGAPSAAPSLPVSRQAPPPTPAPAALTPGLFGPEERVAVTHLRKVIAEAMSLSKHTSAHVTHVDEADVTELLGAHRKVKPLMEKDGSAKFTLMTYFVKAAVAVLKAHPLLNASYDEAAGEVVLKKYYNLGIAVDTPEGLIVPVLKEADRKGMLQIARELQELAARARERRLGLDELKGATFTLTNVGAIGGLMATPVIHQPELAIAAFFAVKERPGIVGGAVVPRKYMNVALTFDHRIIDGAEGARATSELVALLENPAYLMARM
jgi:pyruvate dehydrogenase E2 component (dihydrolipoamide acetyltransferase)